MKNKTEIKKPPPEVCDLNLFYLNFPYLTSSVIETLCKERPAKPKP